MSELHDPELHDLTAVQLGSRIAAGELSSAEAVEHFSQRIQESPWTAGAWISLTLERAAEEARVFDAAGERPSSPLAGVPTGVKDLNPTAGVRTTFGSALYDDFVPEQDDNVSARIKSAGMIVLGKTNTPEFGACAYTENAIAPPAQTPWKAGYMAGGSSGGAAAAVAAGLIPVAQGSDGGGSIRIPASCCGLFGFKPSRGLISGAPSYGDATGLATAGALSRDVRDAAALIDVLAGREPGDAFWVPEAARSFLDVCGESPGRLRIARFDQPVITEAPVDQECLAAFDRMSVLLEELGHEVVDVPAPVGPEAAPSFEHCWAVLTALSPVPEGREDALMPLTRWLIDRGRALDAVEYGNAIAELRRTAARALRAIASFDAVLTPTLASLPLRVGAIASLDPEADFEAQKRFTPFTSLWNIVGMPAVSVPTALSDSGLPIGTMLAAKPGEDSLLFALSAQVEGAIGFPAWRAAGV